MAIDLTFENIFFFPKKNSGFSAMLPGQDEPSAQLPVNSEKLNPTPMLHLVLLQCCCSVLLSVMLQCVVAVSCCSVLLQCVVAEFCCNVLLQCVLVVCCCVCCMEKSCLVL